MKLLGSNWSAAQGHEAPSVFVAYDAFSPNTQILQLWDREQMVSYYSSEYSLYDRLQSYSLNSRFSSNGAISLALTYIELLVVNGWQRKDQVHIQCLLSGESDQ